MAEKRKDFDRSQRASAGGKRRRKSQGKKDRSDREFEKTRGSDAFSRKREAQNDRGSDAESHRTQMRQPDSTILVGRNPVIEALRAGRGISKVMVAAGATGSVNVIAALAREQNILFTEVETVVLDHLAGGRAHQGVIAFVSDFEYSDVDAILETAQERGEDPFVILLDGIEDPHNLGAIIRTADAAGAHGVIIPERRAAVVTPTVEKTSAGATSYVRVARVTNLTKTIRDLKDRGLWIASADMDGERFMDATFTGPIGLVLGSEGRGVSRLVKENCDFNVSIPMRGSVNSLNVSNAAAILMYEVLRQRGQ